MIMILEDDPWRFRMLRAAIRPHRFILCERAHDAIEALKAHSFDHIMLDHDLCDDHYEEYIVEAFGHKAKVSKEATGMTVVDWLVDNPYPVKSIVVHSLNDVRAPVMAAKLQEAGYTAQWVPYCWQKYPSDLVENLLQRL